MNSRTVALACAMALLPALACAEPALTVRATELQAQAQSDAATLAALPEHTRVEILRRSGAWSEVRTANGQTGWVRMLALRPVGDGARPAPAASANPLGALNVLLTSGRTSNTATVTTGVRGLSQEDLQQMESDPNAVRSLQQYGADRAAARAFAQRSKLAPAAVDYLAEPASGAAGQAQRRGEQ